MKKMDTIAEIMKFKEGKQSSGMGLDTPDLDKYLVYKPNRFCCMVGRPNVGKTFFMLWYLLSLSKKYGLKWNIYSIENEIWVLEMFLIEFISGKKIKDINEREIYGHYNWVREHFNFLEQKNYTMEELLKESSKIDSDGLFIDPVNALDKPITNTHEYDYKSIRLIQDYKLTYGSVYVNHHPITASLRRVITDNKSEYFGYPDYSRYYDVEGGGKWFNACDSWISIHRFTSHPMNWNLTSIIVEKEKVVQTGGKVTPKDGYILAEFKNNRFLISGLDPLDNSRNNLLF